MFELKKRVETEADHISVGHNTCSSEVFIELKSSGVIDRAHYMYMSVEETKAVIGYLERAIEDLTNGVD